MVFDEASFSFIVETRITKEETCVPVVAARIVIEEEVQFIKNIGSGVHEFHAENVTDSPPIIMESSPPAPVTPPAVEDVAPVVVQLATPGALGKRQCVLPAWYKDYVAYNTHCYLDRNYNNTTSIFF